MAEGFKNFTAGAVAGETDFDDYLMRQTIMRFADAAARDTALSAVLVEGLRAYTKDSNREWIYTGSAWQLWAGSLPRCRANATVVTTVATSTNTLLNWDGEDYDTDTIHSTASNTSRMTIPAGMSGIWHFETQVQWEPLTGGAATSFRRQIFLLVNAGGLAWARDQVVENTSSEPIQAVSAHIPVSAGDYVQVWCAQFSGGDLDAQLNTTANYFACHFVGPTF